MFEIKVYEYNIYIQTLLSVRRKAHYYTGTISQGLMAHLSYVFISFAKTTIDPLPIRSRKGICFQSPP